MSKSTFLAGLIGLLLISGPGCGDQGLPTQPLPPLQIEDFPFQVGSHWVYHVVDSISGEMDTLDVLINYEEDRPTGERLTTWIFVSRGGRLDFGNQYVSILGDTVLFYLDRSMEAYQKIVFPLSAGKTWSHSTAAGSYGSVVQAAGTVATPLGIVHTFPVHTKLVPLPLDLISESTLMLAKDIGMVQITRTFGFRFPSSVTFWYLIEFEAKAAVRNTGDAQV